MRAHGFAFVTVLIAVPAMAQTNDLDMGARQAVGLFLQACIGNEANINAVRTWMDNLKVPRINGEALRPFLAGRPGVGYNASNSTGHLALTSEDNGVCTVFVESAKDNDVIKSLETSVPNAQQSLKRLNDHADERDPKLHHCDYALTRGGTIYDVVVSTDATPGRIQGMLSFWRRGPNEGPVR